MKRVIVNFLRHFGYQITRAGKGIPRITLADALSHIAKVSRGFGFEPKTVIDIGAADGTYELYRAFPKARFLLVEPLKEFEGELQRICRQYDATYVIAAASNKKGTASINISPELYGSSLLNPKESCPEFKTREVPTVTIDRLVEDLNLRDPFIMKIDAQGSELHILMGAIKAIEKSEVIILESQLFQFADDAPQFYDLVSFLWHQGFVVYDIVGHNYRPLDSALAEVDIVFVKEEGIFRQSHQFASPEQRRKQFAIPDKRF